jgi:hypothetical protein
LTLPLKESVVSMRTISEMNMLLREQVDLPAGLQLATEEFREGWNFAGRIDARRLKKKIQSSGWNFIKIGDGSLHSGVGETLQEAVACALKLALRGIHGHFNAAEVEHIESTHYPWFYLARVRVFPYRIQQDSVLMTPEEDQSLPSAPRSRRLSPLSAALYPQFGSAMPLLKQMLISSHTDQRRSQ